MAADAVTQVATHTSAHQQSIDTTRNRGAPGWSWLAAALRLDYWRPCRRRSRLQVPPDRVGAL